MPRITVLMPAYNAAEEIGSALQSLRGQSFGDFEVLVIDDASTDGTGAVVEAFADPRFRLERNERNVGPAACFNRYLPAVASPLVARMDADDICDPRRLELQVAFLERHPEVAVLGSRARSLRADGSTTDFSDFAHPLRHEEIAVVSLFSAPLVNPTVMFNRPALEGVDHSYRPDYVPASDYELWVRLLPAVRFAALPQRLLTYRRHATQMSTVRRRHQIAKGDLVRLVALRRLGVPLAAEDLAVHMAIVPGRRRPTSALVARAEAWFERLRLYNEPYRFYDPEALAAALAQRLEDLRRRAAREAVSVNTAG